MDRPETGSVAGGHVLVKGIDGVGSGHLTVLLVHVVGARARVVADPDAEVLDLLGALLVDLLRPLAFHSDGLTTVGYECNPSQRLLHTWFTETISPFAFLIFRSFPRKYQNRDLATTSLGAKMRMR